ncbi:helix-turn-helix domain-containing protein [Micromonosporaceae bacterium Da 78-11]
MENVTLSSRQIRVLAHPLRSRLLGSLRLNGPATATQLAGQLDTNTGATSYHLRQLAEVGLVAEEARDGGGRQRWWRPVHQVSSWSRSQYDDDPDAAAAADWMEAEQVNRFAEHAAAWRQQAPTESVAWRDAAEISDYFLTLDPRRTRELLAELHAVIRRYREQPSTNPDARQVLLYLATVPNPEERR